jgi:hypothetical protein
MKTGDLLNTLAGKINQQNNQALIDVLSRQDVQQVDIPDEFANLLAADLMSLDGAKNNASIKSHFTALALNGVDKELGNTVSELGIEDDIFKSEKDTYGKVRTLSAKIKELVEKKGDSGGKEKADLVRQINELNAKMAKIIEEHNAEVGSMKQQHEEHLMDFLVQSSLQGKNYANKDIPAEANTKLAKTLLTEALTQRGAKLVKENNVLKLKQASDATLDLYDENHKPVAYDDFVNKVLADYKLLAVSDPKKVITPAALPGQGGAANPNTAGIDAAIAASISDLN